MVSSEWDAVLWAGKLLTQVRNKGPREYPREHRTDEGKA